MCEQLCQSTQSVCVYSNPEYLLKPIRKGFIYGKKLFPDGTIVPEILVQKYLICGLGLSDEPRVA